MAASMLCAVCYVLFPMLCSEQVAHQDLVDSHNVTSVCVCVEREREQVGGLAR